MAGRSLFSDHLCVASKVHLHATELDATKDQGLFEFPFAVEIHGIFVQSLDAVSSTFTIKANIPSPGAISPAPSAYDHMIATASSVTFLNIWKKGDLFRLPRDSKLKITATGAGTPNFMAQVLYSIVQEAL